PRNPWLIFSDFTEMELLNHDTSPSQPREHDLKTEAIRKHVRNCSRNGIAPRNIWSDAQSRAAARTRDLPFSFSSDKAEGRDRQAWICPGGSHTGAGAGAGFDPASSRQGVPGGGSR